MQEYERPTIRCNPNQVANRPTSSSPALAVAFQEPPPRDTISDPLLFPHPSPFVGLFYEQRKIAHLISFLPLIAFQPATTFAASNKSIIAQHRRFVCWGN